MKGIVVDFGPVRAVDHVDFAVQPGEIVGLLGENGAGKSTLMNVLAGTFPPTEGEILLDGKKVEVNNAQHAMALGIRFIHQELNLCNDLKVFENMYLAQEMRGKGGLLDKKTMAENCRKVLSACTWKLTRGSAWKTCKPLKSSWWKSPDRCCLSAT